MLRHYNDNRIYKNFKIVKILSIVSLVLAVLSIVSYTCVKYVRQPNSGFSEEQFFFYFIIIILPLDFLAPSIKVNQTEYLKTKYLKYENKLINDFNYILTVIILSFLPYILLLFYGLLFAIFGTPNTLSWAYYCGAMMPSHVFLYIADIFLTYNCIYIRNEWNENPPAFIVEKQRQKDKDRIIKERNRRVSQYNKLIEKCGVKFFIKYYEQIVRLPVRDIAVTENYSQREREERILAVRRIIDLNLTEFALTEIINSYSDILAQPEIEKAKTMLVRIKKQQ